MSCCGFHCSVKCIMSCMHLAASMHFVYPNSCMHLTVSVRWTDYFIVHFNGPEVIKCFLQHGIDFFRVSMDVHQYLRGGYGLIGYENNMQFDSIRIESISNSHANAIKLHKLRISDLTDLTKKKTLPMCFFLVNSMLPHVVLRYTDKKWYIKTCLSESLCRDCWCHDTSASLCSYTWIILSQTAFITSALRPAILLQVIIKSVHILGNFKACILAYDNVCADGYAILVLLVNESHGKFWGFTSQLHSTSYPTMRKRSALHNIVLCMCKRMNWILAKY